MVLRLLWSLTATATAAAAAAAAVLSAASCVVGEEPTPTVDYLAMVRSDADVGGAAEELATLDVDVDESFPYIGVLRFRASAEQLVGIVGLETLESIEPVLSVSIDSSESELEATNALADTQLVPWGVTRVGGPGAPSAATLWIVDGGVDLNHPDLRTDPLRSIDLVLARDPDDDADTRHGTAVAGVAAAIDNQRDVVGVAPGALVASVRVLDSGGRGGSDLFVAGLDHLAAHAVADDVVNISIAGPGRSALLEAALIRLADRGIRVVLAAGNSHRDVADFTPAGIRHPSILTVSAIGPDDCLALFSNYGSGVDLAAPGVDVLTLRPGGGSAVVDGTSFAAPLVAGLLLRGQLTVDGAACEDTDARADPIAFGDRGDPLARGL